LSAIRSLNGLLMRIARTVFRSLSTIHWPSLSRRAWITDAMRLPVSSFDW
jgi:hypothetical protein